MSSGKHYGEKYLKLLGEFLDKVKDKHALQSSTQKSGLVWPEFSSVNNTGIIICE